MAGVDQLTLMRELCPKIGRCLALDRLKPDRKRLPNGRLPGTPVGRAFGKVLPGRVLRVVNARRELDREPGLRRRVSHYRVALDVHELEIARVESCALDQLEEFVLLPGEDFHGMWAPLGPALERVPRNSLLRPLVRMRGLEPPRGSQAVGGRGRIVALAAVLPRPVDVHDAVSPRVCGLSVD